MPGSVSAATYTTVLPQILASAYTRTQDWYADQTIYPDGSINVWDMGLAVSRKSWRLREKLTAAELTALRAFYLATKGPTISFLMYEPWETSPQFSYDPTGSAVTGAYIVRFAGSLVHALGLARNEAEFGLVEVG